MKIGKKVRERLIDEIEAAFNKIPRLEPIAYWMQREMATDAADAAIATLAAIQRDAR
jgi:hypothetical protein